VIYHFAWDDLCDWYLELSKETFASGDSDATKRVLGHVLDQLLKLMHPVMPFITEELWTSFTGGESLVISQWPVANASHIDKKSEKLDTELKQ
jgi:valyl-tRNA synthetase